MAKNMELAKNILEFVGGEENITSITNCMTRLRIDVRDTDKVKMEELKNTPGVLGVTGTDNLQVVVGQGRLRSWQIYLQTNLDLKLAFK